LTRIRRKPCPSGVENVDQAEVRRIRAAIRQSETSKDNLIASLSLLSNSEMVTRAQARYDSGDTIQKSAKMGWVGYSLGLLISCK